jgi:outer membrane protein assembly factor BamB
MACSAEVASEAASIPPGGTVPAGGMPGGMLTLSADGAQSGIVWATIPYWDANSIVGPGRLLAYDATQFDVFADGSPKLRLLWDSERENLPFIYNKFTPPVVANGRVYVATYDGRVDVYGLI